MERVRVDSGKASAKSQFSKTRMTKGKKARRGKKKLQIKALTKERT